MTAGPSMEAAARSSASALTSARHTRMPIAATFRAAARPMPLAPPVITAARPAVRAGWLVMGHDLLACCRHRSSPRSRQTQEAPMARVVGIDHLVIRVSDYEKSKQFYDRLLTFLGFKLSE